MAGSTLAVTSGMGVFLGNKGAHTYFGNIPIPGVFGPDPKPAGDNGPSGGICQVAPGLQNPDLDRKQPELIRALSPLRISDTSSEGSGGNSPGSGRNRSRSRRNGSDSRSSSPASSVESAVSRISLGSWSYSDNSEWEKVGNVLLRSARDIPCFLEMTEFVEGLREKGSINEELYAEVKARKRPLDKLRAYIDHVVKHEDTELLVALVCHENLRELEIPNQLKPYNVGSSRGGISSACVDDYVARTVIREAYPRLRDSLEIPHIHTIAETLCSSLVLDQGMRNHIGYFQNKNRKIRYLVDKVMFQGRMGHRRFLDALRKTGNGSIADDMEATGRNVKDKPSVELHTLVAKEEAEFRTYLEITFKEGEEKHWSLDTEEARQEVLTQAQRSMDPFGLKVVGVEAGSLILSLICQSVEGLLNFYEAYRTGQVAQSFAKQIEGGHPDSFARIAIDKHSLLTAITILVNREWPKDTTATYNESKDYRHVSMKTQLQESQARELKLSEELKQLKDRETDLLAQSYLLYKSKGKPDSDAMSTSSEDSPIEGDGAQAVPSEEPDLRKTRGFRAYKERLERMMGPSPMESVSGEDADREPQDITTLPVQWQTVWDQDHITLVQGMNEVAGMAKTDHALFCIHRYDPHVYIYHTGHRRVGRVRIPRLDMPSWQGALAHIPSASPGSEANLAVIGWKSQTLHILGVSINGWNATFVATVELGYLPRSVSVDPMSNTLAITEGWEGGGCIHILGQSKEEASSLQLSKEKVMTGSSVARLSTGQYIVVDYYRDKLVWLDKNGAYISTYPSHSGHPPAHSPTAVAVYQDTVLVAHKHAVMQLSAHGEYMRHIATYCEVTDPTSIVTQGNAVYVGHSAWREKKWQPEIKVFHL